MELRDRRAVFLATGGSGEALWVALGMGPESEVFYERVDSALEARPDKLLVVDDGPRIIRRFPEVQRHSATPPVR